VGPMDGEILISLTEKHTPTAKLIAMLRRELPARFAELQFFFQPADIVDQVLNSDSRRRSMSGFRGRIRTPPLLWRRKSPRLCAASLGSWIPTFFRCPCAGSHGGHGSRARDSDRGDAARGGQ